MRRRWILLALLALLVAACGSDEGTTSVPTDTDAAADVGGDDVSTDTGDDDVATDATALDDMVEGPEWPPIADLAQPVVDWEYASALSIALVRPDAVELATFGTSGTADALDEDMQFEIGSVTKVFTGLLLADAAARDEVEVDGLVAPLLPTEAAAGVPDTTLAQLATHTSGLPRLPDNLAPTDPRDPYNGYTEAMFWDAVARAEPTSPSAYAYSNFGSALLGQALARHQEMSYGELLTERVLTPLGLTETALAPAGPHAQGHAADGSPTPNWDLGVLGPAGALHSNAADLAKLLQAQMRTEGPLSEAIALSQQEHARWELGKMGLGWHFGLPEQPGVMWHNGGTGGFSSFVAVDLDAEVGVVVLASQSTTAADQLGVALLARLQGGDADLTLVPLADVPIETLERYVGRYRFNVTFSIVVTREGDRLFAQATGQQPLRLWPSDDHTFHLRVVDATITFIEEDGVVTALELDQNGVQRADRVD